jgi:hypothetical protein
VVASGQRGGVPLEGSSGRVATSSGVVLRLEAEVREGTAAWCRSRGENTTWGRKNPTDGSGSTLLKGAAGTQWREAGESRAMHGGARGGGSGSHRWVTARVAWHSRQRHGRGVCGCRRVADEQGPDGSERAQGEWGVGACGLAGEGNGVG